MATYNIIILKKSDWRVWVEGPSYQEKKVLTVKDWAAETGADLCFNLGLFALWYGPANGCYARSKGKDISYGGKSEIIAFDSMNACGGYSNGIINGVVKVNAPFGGSSYRNGVGITEDGQIIVAQTKHKCTEVLFCQKVNDFVAARGMKVKTFVLEDGGGSTSEYSAMSKQTFYPAGPRNVATVLCAKRITTPVINRTLHLGCHGDDVKELQIALGGIEADGIFGTATLSKVFAAQKALGIKVDGYVGPVTRSWLFKNVK